MARFVSDEQRKAAFANMARREKMGGGIGGSLFERLGIGTGNSPFDKIWSDFLNNSKGLGFTPAGSYISASGAIYATPDSDWFIGDKKEWADYGSYEGEGVGPYDQQFSLTPEEAAFLYIQNTGLGTLLYNLFVHGTDPFGGTSLVQPYGSPGTLKPFYEASFGADETWKLALARATNSGYGSPFFGGPNADYNAGGINPAFLNIYDDD